MRKLKVTVEGKTYEVTVEMLGEADAGAVPASTTAAPAASLSTPVSSAAPAPAGSNDVPSPLSGKVVGIDVEVGAKVNEGDQVATVEAMKMNTYVAATKAGTVSKVHVTIGQQVEEGQALVTID
jgi:glutaconyl-CoA/methylmalonyl-CoA decarboxylase subunit gamma